MKTDEIRAVELVRRIRDEQREALKDKSAEERRSFYLPGARAKAARAFGGGIRADEERVSLGIYDEDSPLL